MFSDNSQTSPHFVSKLGREFFNVPCQQLAQSLLGQIVARRENSTVLRGRIVETESYLGGEDLASHSHHGRITQRTAPTFMVPGTVYVAPVYGMYSLFNISSQGDGASVLVRALEPVCGLEDMKRKRALFAKKRKKNCKMEVEEKSLKFYEVCNGPSKLAVAMSIEPSMSGQDLVKSTEIWIEAGPETAHHYIVECPRIGVDFAGKLWATKPLRYYILGNSCVSKRDKKAELQASIKIQQL